MKELKTLAEFKEFVGSGNSVVDFWADYCAPCRMMAPKFEEISKRPEMTDVKFAKVDVNSATDLFDIFSELGISSIPSFITFKDGKKTANGHKIGASAPDDLAAWIKTELK